jgi:hypothetical protein
MARALWNLLAAQAKERNEEARGGIKGKREREKQLAPLEWLYLSSGGLSVGVRQLGADEPPQATSGSAPSQARSPSRRSRRRGRRTAWFSARTAALALPLLKVSVTDGSHG